MSTKWFIIYADENILMRISIFLSMLIFHQNMACDSFFSFNFHKIYICFAIASTIMFMIVWYFINIQSILNYVLHINACYLSSYHALQDFTFNVKIRIYEYLWVCEIANINLNIGQGLLIKNRAKLTGFCFQNNLLWMLDERVSDIW